MLVETTESARMKRTFFYPLVGPLLLKTFNRRTSFDRRLREYGSYRDFTIEQIEQSHLEKKGRHCRATPRNPIRC